VSGGGWILVILFALIAFIATFSWERASRRAQRPQEGSRGADDPIPWPSPSGGSPEAEAAVRAAEAASRAAIAAEAAMGYASAAASRSRTANDAVRAPLAELGALRSDFAVLADRMARLERRVKDGQVTDG
jgi:hypothetical protein